MNYLKIGIYIDFFDSKTRKKLKENRVGEITTSKTLKLTRFK